MKCPGCGEMNPDGYMYCIGCGVNLSGMPSKQDTEIRSFFNPEKPSDMESGTEPESKNLGLSPASSPGLSATGGRTSKSHRKRNAGIVIVAVVLAAFVIFSLLPQPASTVPAGFLAFKHQSPTWSIDYPNSWNSSQTGSTSQGQVSFNGSADVAVIVGWFVGLSLASGSSNTLAFVKNQSNGYHLVSLNNTTVDGLPAVIIKTYNMLNGTNYTENDIMVANGGYFYSIVWGGNQAGYQSAYSMAGESAGTFKLG